MDTIIYRATTHDCAANLAGEAYLLTQSHDRILYLWSNDPCIVIGRYQNPHTECNLPAMDEDGVALIRRLSGGGAVYHDRGNLCFTLIGNKDDASKEENFALLLDALSSLGIECELSGRNDILYDGRKISGNAFQTTKNRFCHHGTLLITSELGVMGRYLTPSDRKLASKAVRSVSSRVGNLSEARRDITPEEVEQALIGAFIKAYGPSLIQDIDFSTFGPAIPLAHTFGDRNTILAKTPPFSHTVQHRFGWGEISLHLDVRGGIIEDVRCYTDSPDTSISPHLEACLKGIRYERAALRALREEGYPEPIDDVLGLLVERL